MNLVFPHAANASVPLEQFVAAWIVWIHRFHPPADWRTAALPRGMQAIKLRDQLAKGREGGVDVLCRMLLPVRYRNTMQATNPFMRANESWLQRASCVGKKRLVEGAVLRPEAVAYWDRQPVEHRAQLISAMEAVIESDWEVAGNKGIETVLLGSEGGLVKEGPSVVSAPPPGALAGWAKAVIEAIEGDPYLPRYRRETVDAPHRGWHARLAGYFWPNPSVGPSANAVKTADFERRFRPLFAAVQADRTWTQAQCEEAVSLSVAVFKWGGVGYREPAAATVRSVLESAAKKVRCQRAPMSSGWTKVVAMATAGSAAPEVIWDSRVATSVLSRLDQICHAKGLKSVPQELKGLGYVNGRDAGTRPRRLFLRWPNGYGSWAAQFAGSTFVRAIRSQMNQLSPKRRGRRSWSLRQVEQVLFMDGY